jgi:hypothetical protein
VPQTCHDKKSAAVTNGHRRSSLLELLWDKLRLIRACDLERGGGLCDLFERQAHIGTFGVYILVPLAAGVRASGCSGNRRSGADLGAPRVGACLFQMRYSGVEGFRPGPPTLEAEA